MKFPHCIQLDAMDCGPTCLRMIAKFYRKNYSLRSLRTKCHITRAGVSMLGISPSGDPFFDDPRNLQAIREAIEQAKRGQVTELTPELKEKLFGDL